jgi:hypothetical protein
MEGWPRFLDSGPLYIHGKEVVGWLAARRVLAAGASPRLVAQSLVLHVQDRRPRCSVLILYAALQGLIKQVHFPA